jgi:hypothetical protein
LRVAHRRQGQVDAPIITAYVQSAVAELRQLDLRQPPSKIRAGGSSSHERETE